MLKDLLKLTTKNRLHTITLLCCLAALSCSVSANNGAYQTQSIRVENRSPFVMLFALARPDYQPFLETGQYQYSFRTEIGNYLSGHNGARESMLIDGETLILTQSLSWRLDAYQIRLSLPWIRHSRGKLDRAIYNFHDLFHLPQNGRKDDQHDLIRWHLGAQDNSLAALNDRVQSLGDVSIEIARELESNWQIKGLLKLPSGNFSKQSGSEAADIGLSFSQANPEWMSQRNWLTDVPLSFWWGAGLSYLGKADRLDQLQRYPFVATMRAGTAWQITASWEVKVQLDSNTPLFDSEIRELGWLPLQASLAGQYNFLNRHSLSAAIIEDLRPRVTPDVIFNLEYSLLF